MASCDHTPLRTSKVTLATSVASAAGAAVVAGNRRRGIRRLPRVSRFAANRHLARPSPIDPQAESPRRDKRQFDFKLGARLEVANDHAVVRFGTGNAPLYKPKANKARQKSKSPVHAKMHSPAYSTPSTFSLGDRSDSPMWFPDLSIERKHCGMAVDFLFANPTKVIPTMCNVQRLLAARPRCRRSTTDLLRATISGVSLLAAPQCPFDKKRMRL